MGLMLSHSSILPVISTRLATDKTLLLIMRTKLFGITHDLVFFTSAANLLATSQENSSSAPKHYTKFDNKPVYEFGIGAGGGIF